MPIAMEILLQSPITSIVGIVSLLLFLYYRLFIGYKDIARKRAAPEPAGAWPVIGHLHLLGKSQLAHITLGNMADKYGPIFTLKLGVRRALVVSNWEMAKECFTTNDKAFANRPKAIAMEQLGYNFAMFAVSPYGPYWRQLRKIVRLELLTHHRLEMLNHVQESEVRSSMKDIYKQWAENKKSGSGSDKVQVEMKRWFGDRMLNVVVRMVAGKRSVEAANTKDDRWRKALRDFFHFVGMFMVSDAFPSLRWLDFGGYEKAMKKTAKEMDRVLDEWLEEHKRSRISAEMKDSDQQDFMDAMLSILDDDGVGKEPQSYDADTINKSTCLALILGGTDTTAITLTWALSLLLNNRHALKKAQDELDLHIGRERQLKESDMKNLVYLQAIIKETMRLYPAAPLSSPREAITDCTIDGYHVPAGTRLVVNLYKIHRDPGVWSDPYEFRPERFLTTHKDIDVKGQHFEFIPFGSGRRVCPGISFALQVIQFTLASLLHGFEIKNPSDEAIDMSECSGMTNLKATPLDVLLTPRLPDCLYG